MTLALLDEAVAGGARLERACELLGLSSRTVARWRRCAEDRRAGPKSTPGNKLSRKEVAKMLRIANEPEFRNLPPSQIVPRLADRGLYIASVSSFYRVLERERMKAHRGRAKTPEARVPVVRYATRPNQVWSWDIT